MNSKEYAQNQGYQCPVCGSPHINGEGQLEADTGVAWQDCFCEDCDARWQDVYALTGYDNLVTPVGKNRYIIEFFNGSEACSSHEQFTGNTPQHAIALLKRDFPLATVQNVALVIDWD